jgi:hypothetical protein
MIGSTELAKMRKGAHLINAARGTVVDIDALDAALASGHVGGAALDVFPVEPKGNGDIFESPLTRHDNVILTPHVGGSTLEAQDNIGVEVAAKLVRYSDNGSTLSAVNFPEVTLPEHATACACCTSTERAGRAVQGQRDLLAPQRQHRRPVPAHRPEGGLRGDRHHRQRGTGRRRARRTGRDSGHAADAHPVLKKGDGGLSRLPDLIPSSPSTRQPARAMRCMDSSDSGSAATSVTGRQASSSDSSLSTKASPPSARITKRTS